jgi:hypothetical protein
MTGSPLGSGVHFSIFLIFKTRHDVVASRSGSHKRTTRDRVLEDDAPNSIAGTWLAVGIYMSTREESCNIGQLAL